MTARMAAGALAATCSVILLTGCGGGGQSASTVRSASKSPASTSSSAPSSTPSGTSTSSVSGSSSATAAAAQITIKDFDYQVPSSVKPGAKVTITDSDGAAHTVTSDQGGLFNAVVTGGGGTAAITAPTKPGKYPFHCTYHGNMHGTLVVS